MSFAQNSLDLQAFNIALHPRHFTTILPNLSYPSRPNLHIPWSGSSAPLLFSKTTRLEMTIVTSPANAQIPITSNIFFDTCSVPQAFHRINLLIWHHLSVIVRKLILIKQKFFGVGARSLPIMASVRGLLLSP